MGDGPQPILLADDGPATPSNAHLETEPRSAPSKSSGPQTGPTGVQTLILAQAQARPDFLCYREDRLSCGGNQNLL